jgi:hypothetical protein
MSSIGDNGSIVSKSLEQADGWFDKTRAQPDKGAGSNVGGRAGGGGYGRIPISAVDPKVRGSGPSPASPPQRKR